jgi:hypothetical protein
LCFELRTRHAPDDGADPSWIPPGPDSRLDDGRIGLAVDGCEEAVLGLKDTAASDQDAAVWLDTGTSVIAPDVVPDIEDEVDPGDVVDAAEDGHGPDRAPWWDAPCDEFAQTYCASLVGCSKVAWEWLFGGGFSPFV